MSLNTPCGSPVNSCVNLSYRSARENPYAREIPVKAAGLMLLAAGWLLVLAAIGLLAANGPRIAFLLAGIGVEILGIVLLARAHLTPKEDQA